LARACDVVREKRRMRKKIVEPIFDVLEVIYRILL
jgi:hypothetical protein